MNQTTESKDSALPAGTVTFLFTDIDGSTPLWEQMPGEMQVALAQHHALLRQAIEANAGQVYQVIGDEFQAAFRLASDGLAAAIAAQRALQAAKWGATGPLRVRMGLHTGPAELDLRGDAPYAVSHTLNRAARIMSAGHGGQILLSQEARDLAERSLPAGASLRSLGEHLLKGLSTPEALYQLVVPGLAADFPPLASAIQHPHNLSQALTSFIGREQEIAHLTTLLAQDSCRLLTLTGSGGTGKTRLALQVGAQALPSFPDGVWLVELAPLADPELVAASAAQALGLREVPGVPILDTLMGYLKNRQLLLILDNCEHILTACSFLAQALLKNCPRLKLLATSREILNVPGEQPFRVPSLPAPDPRRLPALAELAQAEAVRLFVERASQAAPGFELDEDNARAVATICHRLDGIPLAIELAAARVRVMPVAQITARLDNLFRLLMGGSRTVMPRQQTLKATIDWSYTLLSPQERLALQRLAVFSGGWTLNAAEEVCADYGHQQASAASAAEEVCADYGHQRISAAYGAEEVRSEEGDAAEQAICPEEVLDLLASLVDKSLVILTNSERGEGRYRMLETIRQYARDRLLEAGGGEAVRDRHLHYYLALAEDFDRRVRGPEQVQCLDSMESELDNLRLALEWSLVGHLAKGLRLAGALKWFWHIPNKHDEGRQWLKRLATIEAEARGDRPLAVGVQSTGHLLGWTRFMNTLALIGTDAGGIFTDKHWQAMLEQNVQLCIKMGDIASRELVYALLWRGVSIFFTDPDECNQFLQQGLTICRENGFRFEEAELMFFYWWGAYLMGNIPEGQKYLEEGLAICQQMQDVDGIATRLSHSVLLASYRGEHAKASAFFEEGVHYYQRVRNIRSLHSMSVDALLIWPDSDMIGRAEHALAFFIETHDDSYTFWAYSNLMTAEWSNGNFERAKHLADQGLEIFASRKLVNDLNFGYFFLRIGRLALSLGDDQKARQNIKMSLPYFLRNNPVSLAAATTDLLDSLAVLFAHTGGFPRAVQVLGAIEDYYQHFLFQILPRQRSEHDEALRAAREALGEAAYNAAWQAGRAMTLAQALEYAVEGLGAGGDPA